MRRITPHLTALAVAALFLGACADEVVTPTAAPRTVPEAPLAITAAGSLQWFGYADGAVDDVSLRGQESYTNFNWVIAGGNPDDGWVGSRVNTMAGLTHPQKAIVELGQLLWCGAPLYNQLCPNPQSRIRRWKAANRDALESGRVIAWVVRDEPFVFGVNPADWEHAARLVRDSLPGPKILLIESAYQVEQANSAFNRDTLMKTVDWVGVDIYGINPASSTLLDRAVTNLKQRFPGRGIVYAGDGYFAPSPHIQNFGNNINVMRGIATAWYDRARNDPDAVVFGFFIWTDVEGGKGSRNFPPYVLAEHTRIGREITARVRPTLYAPTGRLDAVTNSGSVTGYACDPDAAWGEVVSVSFYSNGRLAGTTTADRPSSSTYAACRTGNHRDFQAQITGPLGSVVIAVATDLNGGTATLPALPWVQVAWVQPSGITWGPPNTLTVAGWARNGSGGVALDWRDITFSTPPYTRAPYQPTPATADATWSNTVPVSNYCHTYQVKATFFGLASVPVTWNGKAQGFCNEAAKVIWIQPSSTAGFGPPGSLIVAGEATGAPAGTLVEMWYRNLTTGGAWTLRGNAGTDPNGIWINDIPNANPAHRYAVYANYDVITTSTCTYAGTNGITWC